jgi:hypothetical protein
MKHMKHISFALTERQFLDGSKTVVAMFCREMSCTPDTIVGRIEYEKHR